MGYTLLVTGVGAGFVMSKERKTKNNEIQKTRFRFC